MDRMADRQTSGMTEREAGKTAGRYAVLFGRRTIDKTQ
jgi:hypothetical protein